MIEWLGMTKSCPELYDELAGTGGQTQAWLLPREQHRPGCARVNASLGGSDCQVGSHSTAEMDRGKTPMLLALGMVCVLIFTAEDSGA